MNLKARSHERSYFDNSKPPPSSSKSFIGKTYTFKFHNPNGQEFNGTFLKFITITCSYLETDIGDVDESSLAAYRSPTGSTEWIKINNSVVDTANNTVTFKVKKFSSFSILGDEEEEDSNEGGGGGTSGSTSGGGPPSLFGTFSGLGIVSQSLSSVVYYGIASPNSTVTILQDGSIVSTHETDDDGNFSATRSNMTPGSYIFSLFSTDRLNSRSGLLSFRLEVLRNTLTEVSNIVISPSLSLAANSKISGLLLEGIGLSGTKVELKLTSIGAKRSQLFYADTDVNGRYEISIPLTVISSNEYLAKVRTIGLSNDTESPYGRALRFIVGDSSSLPNQTPDEDFNGDQKVNIIDFSMIVYWLKRDQAPEKYDLNKDGNVTLIDLSIVASRCTL